jgi:hypothetical protein
MNKKFWNQAGVLLAAAIIAGCGGGGGGDSTTATSSGAATIGSSNGGAAAIPAGDTSTGSNGPGTGTTGAGGTGTDTTGAGGAGSEPAATTGFAAQQTQQVNTTTAGDQISPSVAALAGGGYVVVWSSADKVQAQIYAAQDQKLGGEVTVFSSNPQGARIASSPAVAALPDGAFIVTVGALLPMAGAPPQWSFYAQRVDASGHLVPTGTPSSADFNAGLASVVTTESNSNGTLINIRPGPILVRPDGTYSISYTLVFQPTPSPNSTDQIQNYEATGTRIGTLVTLGGTGGGSLARFPDGNLLKAYQRDGPAGGGVSWTITTIGGQQVGHMDMPGPAAGFVDFDRHVAILSDGTAVLVWRREVGSSSSLPWLAMRINADGSPAGDPVTLPLPQDVPRFTVSSVTSLPDGGFLVAWPSSATGPLLASFFDNTATAVTDVFQLASQIGGNTGSAPAPQPQYDLSPLNGGFILGFSATAAEGLDIFAERFVATH